MSIFLADIKLLGKQDLLATTSADKTARVWKTLEDGRYTTTAVLKEHTGEVTGVAPHGLTDYFATASLDKTWCFYDTTTATCIQQVGLSFFLESLCCLLGCLLVLAFVLQSMTSCEGGLVRCISCKLTLSLLLCIDSKSMSWEQVLQGVEFIKAF